MRFFNLFPILIFCSLICDITVYAETADCKNALVSGELIKVATDDGIGVLHGHDLIKQLLGAASVYNNKRPDIFMSNFSNGSYKIMLYRWIDDVNGVPVFTNPIECGHTFDKGLVPKHIFQNKDGIIHSIWCANDKLVVSAFDVTSKTFKEPNQVQLFGFEIDTNTPITLLNNPDGSVEVITVVAKTDNGYGYMGQQVERMHSRGPFFNPFDGAGIWRGELPYASLYAFSLPCLTEGPAANYRMVSKRAKDVSFSYGLSLAVVNLGKGRQRDLIGGGQFGNMHYYRNLAQSGIDFESYRYVTGDDGVVIRHPTIDASPIAYPNAETGLSDLLSMGEGNAYYYKFTGRFKNNSPVYESPIEALEKNTSLCMGLLVVINVLDWDGDGLLDIISGNSQGTVVFSKNIGTVTKPCFTPARELDCHGQKIHLQPGYRGSVQGPMEARWGYTCPRVIDWNEDGLPDLILSGSTAVYQVYMNIGTKTSPKLDYPSPIYVDGLDLHGTWRSQPAVEKLGNRMAFICLDDQDELHLYWRIDNFNLEDGGKLKLSDGSYIKANYRYAGGTGRLKLNLADWDGDGNKDLVIGTMRESSVPDVKRGLPSSLGKDAGSAVLLMRNCGTNESPVFEKPQLLYFDDKPVFLGIHSCSPAIADLNNDGKADLLVGQETGTVLFFDRNSNIEFRKIDFNDISVICRWQKGTINNFWNNPENWWRGVPDVNDDTLIQENTKVLLNGSNARCRQLLLSNGAFLTVEANETLTSSSLIVGLYEEQQSSLMINGGIVTVDGDIIVGKKNGSGSIVIKDGSLKGRRIVIGVENGRGIINIDKGNIVLISDCTKAVKDYVDKGFITGYQGKGQIIIKYDSNLNQTKVNAVLKNKL